MAVVPPLVGCHPCFSLPQVLNMEPYTRGFLDAQDTAKDAAQAAAASLAARSAAMEALAEGAQEEKGGDAAGPTLVGEPQAALAGASGEAAAGGEGGSAGKAASARRTRAASEGAGRPTKEGRPAKDPAFDYALKGVLIHIGDAGAGHYYSLIKDSRGRWLNFNDHDVSPFAQDMLKRESFGGGSSQEMVPTAYMLFYERIHPEAPEEDGPLRPPLLVPIPPAASPAMAVCFPSAVRRPDRPPPPPAPKQPSTGARPR